MELLCEDLLAWHAEAAATRSQKPVESSVESHLEVNLEAHFKIYSEEASHQVTWAAELQQIQPTCLSS